MTLRIGASWRWLALLAWVPLRAEPAAVPEAEALQPPTAQRFAAIAAEVQREGWAAQVPVLRTAARLAYGHEKWPAAEAWYYANRWADLLGRSEAEFLTRWIEAVDAARVGHSNMATRYTPTAKPLGASLAPEVQAWLIGSPVFSKEFFEVLSPLDYIPRVFAIINELYRAEPARFKANANLALAIAVVYDVPPPPVWPHGQVTAAALSRKMATPLEAFAWWTRQEQLGRTYHKLSRLGAAELKFVVDASAPFAELEWSQNTIHQTLDSLASVYGMIRYRNDRVTSNVPIWPGQTYLLSEILAEGGICADQAYFATQVGKARGVPTLLFSGAGNDARHAWFGFLDGSQKWQLDASRYAEQRFVTGYARDPQTWRELTDHELQFLAERFRDSPAYRQSQLHAAFAADYLATGEGAPAAVAARKAVNYERRNLRSWELLAAAAKKEGRDARTLENIYREAAIAFRDYPDLEALFVNRVSESLRSRGETSAADAEARRIGLKNQGTRVDLSVQQARDVLVRAISTQPLPERIRSYNSVLDSYGRGAGIGFFDAVVSPFIEHLIKLQQPAEAMTAIDRAQRTLKVEANSQLERELAQLRATVVTARGKGAK